MHKMIKGRNKNIDLPSSLQASANPYWGTVEYYANQNNQESF